TPTAQTYPPAHAPHQDTSTTVPYVNRPSCGTGWGEASTAVWKGIFAERDAPVEQDEVTVRLPDMAH
ncbi:MAG: hypothetical protein KDE47_13775, partial [Caldilineaceae bacterium]|nr:hypothetical protein [Caldilineaceae bacterium]